MYVCPIVYIWQHWPGIGLGLEDAIGESLLADELADTLGVLVGHGPDGALAPLVQVAELVDTGPQVLAGSGLDVGHQFLEALEQLLVALEGCLERKTLVQPGARLLQKLELGLELGLGPHELLDLAKELLEDTDANLGPLAPVVVSY